MIFRFAFLVPLMLPDEIGSTGFIFRVFVNRPSYLVTFFYTPRYLPFFEQNFQNILGPTMYPTQNGS